MTDHEVISVETLSSSFSTRRRGEEAFERLWPMLTGDQIFIDLDGVGLLSPSFLDGLLLKLRRKGIVDMVVFKTCDERTLGRLQRLVDLRSITVHTSNQRDAVKRLLPSSP